MYEYAPAAAVSRAAAGRGAETRRGHDRAQTRRTVLSSCIMFARSDGLKLVPSQP
eukprot:COSAG03_NODE_20815_length_313_cov_0.920561_1_plen_54_part_10